MKRILPWFKRVCSNIRTMALLFFLIAFLPVLSFAQEYNQEIMDDLKYFLTILEPDTCATVALAKDFCFQACADQDWMIMNHYYNTLGRTTDKEEWAIRSYFSNIRSEEYRQISPSFYLLWLRKKLPASPYLSIIRIEESREEGYEPFQSISVKLDDMPVQLIRYVDEVGRHLWGRIETTQINGRSEVDLFEEDISQGLMDPFVAEFWGSRETGYEFCGRKMPYRVIDGLPVIVEEDKDISSGKNGRDEKKETN